MKKLLIYAHFNSDGVVSSESLYTLEHFRALGFRIVVASTSTIDSRSIRRLGESGIAVILVPNIGYDFYAWKTALFSAPEAFASDRVVLLNSSVQGPFRSLKRFLERIELIEADIIGATLSTQPVIHLQSYFFYLKRTALTSSAFRQYWSDLLPFPDREQTIQHHELGFYRYLVNSGIRTDAFVRNNEGINPMTELPYRMVFRGLPFVKTARLNGRRHIPLKLAMRLMFKLNRPRAMPVDK